ncbi:MAG: hypothetical protein NVSMB2_04190 [Chloroflexota bacterium]
MTQTLSGAAKPQYVAGGGPTAGVGCGPYDLLNVPFEPILQLDQIQGNVLGGFNKDHQTLIYLRIDDVEKFREWLRGVLPLIATAQQVVQFNRLYKLLRESGNVIAEQSVRVTWINIAFSHAALKKLTDDTPGHLAKCDFKDEAFVAGMAARGSNVLGDPSDVWTTAQNPAREPDVVVIIASDSLESMGATVQKVTADSPENRFATVLGVEEGHNDRSHTGVFGFRDGISQPGVRGVCSPRPDDFLTPRLNPRDPNEGLPGQALVWPGEFVLGYRTESMDEPDLSKSQEDAFNEPVVSPEVGPDWAANGSYLAFRRLREDLKEFEHQVDQASGRVGLAPDIVKAEIVGRWQDGAPLGRELAKGHPREPARSDGFDACTNNNFNFENSVADVVCPVGAHIRKAFPRQGQPVDQRRHRILRRGISYGHALSTNDDDQGLLFLAYQASLVDQFEMISGHMNNPDFGEKGAGYDLIAGQNGSDARFLRLVGGAEIRSDQPFVRPTGGGYYFTPSLWALSKIADPGVASWTPVPTRAELEDRVKYAYYMLGRFIYEQAPYATGPDLKLSADFYHSADTGPFQIQSDGLAKSYGLHPFDGAAQQLFRRSSSQLDSDDQMKCLWWYFLGSAQRVTKAIRIPYRYTRAGDDTLVDAALLLGFAGPGNQ